MATPKKQRSWWPWIVGVLLVVSAGYAMKRGRGDKGETIDESLVITIKKKDLPIEVVETGKVQPREKVEIKSKVPGQVDKVLVDEGQHVEKGQLLLRLDPTDYRR